MRPDLQQSRWLLNHISNLPHDEFLSLYHQGKIKVSADMSMSMHICDKDPRIRKPVKVAHHFWKWAGLLMLVGGPISIVFIKWYFGALIFWGSFIVINATRKSAAQFVMEEVFMNESFYRDCLANNVLFIKWA